LMQKKLENIFFSILNQSINFEEYVSNDVFCSEKN
jgi:hypothetical protein